MVVDLGDGIHNFDHFAVIRLQVRAEDVGGPLGDLDDPFKALIAELAGGGIYINIHTAEYPAGEIRGQVGRGISASAPRSRPTPRGR